MLYSIGQKRNSIFIKTYNSMQKHRSKHQYQLDNSKYALPHRDISTAINLNHIIKKQHNRNHRFSIPTRPSLFYELNNNNRQKKAFYNHQKYKSVERKNKLITEPIEEDFNCLKRKNDGLKINKYGTIHLNKNNNVDIDKHRHINNDNLDNTITQAIINLIHGRVSQVSSGNLKCSQIILQKYIQNPYLINNSKFDIRIWVLISPSYHIFIYKSGYLRFSSQKYSLSHQNINNNFIHLTNHAVQKHSEKYVPEETIVDMIRLEENIKEKYGEEQGRQKYESIMKEMERIVKISIQATIGKKIKINNNNNSINKSTSIPRTTSINSTTKQFQIFGYDFLLDRELNIRLIQTNCNPAITEDSEYLKYHVPRMLDDMFKLTIDKYFGMRNGGYGVKYGGEADRCMDGNMWKRVGRVGEIIVSQIKRSFQ